MATGTTTETVLRPLLPDDLPAAQALTASFAWPHRLEDWQFMLGLGRGVAAEQGGRLVGTALGWRFGTDWAALGLVGVAQALQGRGFGRRLVEAVLDDLGGRRVLLHGTEAGLPLYRSLGFVPTGTVRQHQGRTFGAGLIALPEGERLRPIGRSDPDVLAALDRTATGMDRQAALSAVLQVGTGVVLDRGGEPIGFALLRRFGRGHVVGPVVAPDAERARALIGHFLASRSGEFMRVDVPEASGLSPWLAGLDLADAGPAIRMERGSGPGEGDRGADAPARPGARSFTLISQAFG